MKISLHIEADTPEEFDKALNSIVKFDILAAALEDRSYSEPPPPWTDRAIKAAHEAAQQEPAPAPKPAPQPIPPQPEPQEPKPAPEPDEEDVPPVVAQEPVQAKRQRGRPRKEKPVEVPREPSGSSFSEGPLHSPAAAPVKAKEAAIEVASRQDLLDVFSEYVQRYGASFGFTDISTLLQKHLGDGVRKASDVPEQQLTQAIGAIRQAIAENPFNRKRDYNA